MGVELLKSSKEKELLEIWIIALLHASFDPCRLFHGFMFDGDVIKLLQKFCSKNNVFHTLVLRWSNTRTGAIAARCIAAECHLEKKGP